MISLLSLHSRKAGKYCCERDDRVAEFRWSVTDKIDEIVRKPMVTDMIDSEDGTWVHDL